MKRSEDNFPHAYKMVHSQVKFILIILMILAISTNLFADCEGGTFEQNYFKFNLNDSSKIFVKGIKVEDYYHGIKLKILENYSENELKDTIKVWYCNPRMIFECNSWDVQSAHSVNDTLFCLLRKIQFCYGNIIRCDTCPQGVDTIDLEKPGDYEISGCYPSVLKLSQGKVSGCIFDVYRDTSILYSYFEDLFISSSDKTIPDLIIKEVRIFPNPSAGEIKIILPEVEFINYMEVYNNLGKLLDKKIIRKEIDLINYSLTDFESGSYFIRLVLSNDVITKQIIKN